MASQGGFQARNRKGARGALPVPGSRVSVHNTQQLLVSSGIPSLDDVIGGGIPIGSILLVEEDDNATYSEFFLKCFLAEGVTVGHEIFLASLDKSPEKMMQSLPCPVQSQETEASSSQSPENMVIAWRYEQKKKHSSQAKRLSLGHNLDLKTDMSSEMLMNSEKFCWGGFEKCCSYQNDSSRNPYRELFKDLNNLVTRRQLTAGNRRAETNIMRVAIHSIGSFSWGNELNHELQDHAWEELTTFFSLLHSLLRDSYSVGFLTVPSHRFADYSLMARLTQPTCIISLESFQGSDKEVNPLFKDYHGQLTIQKLSAINSLIPPTADTKDWVFKLKRKRLCIEKLHLPPDLSETASRSQADPVKNTAAMCSGGAAAPSVLDF